MTALLATLINAICYLCEIVLFLRLLVAWFDLSPYSPGARLVLALTEPVLRPLRRALSGWRARTEVDLSPVLALIVVEFLRQLLTRALT